MYLRMLSPKLAKLHCACVYLSICLSIYLSVCLSIYLSICLPIYLAMYIFINQFIISHIFPSPPPHHSVMNHSHLSLLPDIIRLTSLCDGQTALHRAAYWDRHKIVSLLLNEDPQCANIQDADGNTALHLACRKAHKNTIKALLVRKLVSTQQK